MKRLLLAVAFVVATPALAAPSDDLKSVIDDHWANWLAENPFSATSLGERRYDTKVPDLSLAEQDRSAAKAQVFLNRLNAIPDALLSGADRTNKGVLARLLKDQIAGNAFGQRLMLFSSYSSPHQWFAGLGEGLPFYKRADYDSYLIRLSQFPQVNAQVIEIDKQAIAKGFVQPCVTLNGYEDTISGPVAGPAEETRFFEPFRRARPADMTDAEWTAMKARAAWLVREVIAREYRRYLAHYLKSYKPKCATKVGASNLPQGPAYYAFRAAVHTTTDLTPDQIHKIGVSEVERVRARMEEVAKRAGYADRKAFAAKLRSDPVYYAKTPEALLSVASRIAKGIDGKMPQYFATLPRLPYGLKEIPKETAETTTTAYYSPGSPVSGIAGNYYVNTSKLDQRPLFELPALTAHEAVPGHHHQIALQQELDLPEFRKHVAGFTAFVEGWGLYGEFLGEEMGLYDTPEKMMGRLSYEMWRACRLVVDTGMHSKGWTKDQAIAFMRDNTALSDANIEAEVNRYISWPGQALGYKIGEIRIRELRALAEKSLGTKFDLRRFHDAVLTQGAVPLDVLERQIDDWIAAEKARG